MKQILLILTILSLSSRYSLAKAKGEIPWNLVQDKLEDSLQFTIFPNPLKNKILYIKSSSKAIKHIEIYNVLGEKKFETKTFEDQIFLEELKTGLYIFRLEQEYKTGLKRLVVP